MGSLQPLDKVEASRPFSMGVHIGFEIIRAEDGAWVLSDYDPRTGHSRRHVCADNPALVAQMRAWMDRAVANFEKSQAAPVRIVPDDDGLKHYILFCGKRYDLDLRFTKDEMQTNGITDCEISHLVSKMKATINTDQFTISAREQLLLDLGQLWHEKHRA